MPPSPTTAYTPSPGHVCRVEDSGGNVVMENETCRPTVAMKETTAYIMLRDILESVVTSGTGYGGIFLRHDHRRQNRYHG